MTLIAPDPRGPINDKLCQKLLNEILDFTGNQKLIHRVAVQMCMQEDMDKFLHSLGSQGFDASSVDFVLGLSGGGGDLPHSPDLLASLSAAYDSDKKLGDIVITYNENLEIFYFTRMPRPAEVARDSKGKFIYGT